METAIIKKRLNTFKSGKGVLNRVSDEVVMEVLRGWESWPGSSADFYREIGLSKQQLAILIGKGKRLVKSGVVAEGDFKELKLDSLVGKGMGAMTGGIEMSLEANRVVRFSQIDQLVEFLKKTS